MSEPNVLNEKTARILPWVVAIAFFMQMLDGTILNTALPAIGDSLNVSALQMHAAVIAYMLTVALLIPASGWLADRFGTRTVFLYAIFLFTLGSLFCACALNIGMLIAARILQGVGGALLLPVGRLVVLKAYPRDQLVKILSFVTIPGLLGPLMGPTLGGFLVEYASWEWIFLINLPVGILGAVCAWFYMPNMSRSEGLGGFDKLGFVLFGSFMLTSTIALEGIGAAHFSLSDVFLLVVISVVSLTAYFFHARRDKNAIFHADLFKTRHFTVGIIGNLFARLSTGAMPFLTPLLLQLGLGFPPLLAGMTMIPTTLGAMSVKKIMPPLIEKLGYRRLLSVNTLMLGALIATFSFIDRQTHYSIIIVLFSIFGICISTQFTALNTVTLIDLPDEHAASGNSLLSVTMQLSMSMGIACAAAILGGFSSAQAIMSEVETINAFKYTYFVLGLMAALSTPIFFYLRPKAKAEPLLGKEAHSKSNI